MTDVVDACAVQWSLSLEGRLEGETGARVFTATRSNGTPVVLKLTDPDDRDAEHEAAALTAWDGDGAVRLLEHDPERGAFLLERLEPGTQAWELDEDEATLVVADVLRRLHRVSPAPGHPFVLLADAARGWAVELPELRPVVDDLLADPTPQVLLHQDLHGGNVLRSARGWLAIDPKPLVGDPAFDVASLVRDRDPSETGNSSSGASTCSSRNSATTASECAPGRGCTPWRGAGRRGSPDPPLTSARGMEGLGADGRGRAVPLRGGLRSLGEQIRLLLDAGVRIFHFDVGDGHFVEPSRSGRSCSSRSRPRSTTAAP